MSDRTPPVSMHMARSAMNGDPAIRAWVEEWLKARERSRYMATDGANDEGFERHWRYVRPETMHEGALEGYAAYVAASEAG